MRSEGVEGVRSVGVEGVRSVGVEGVRSVGVEGVRAGRRGEDGWRDRVNIPAG